MHFRSQTRRYPDISKKGFALSHLQNIYSANRYPLFSTSANMLEAGLYETGSYIFISTRTFSLSYTWLEINVLLHSPFCRLFFFFFGRLFFEAISKVAESSSHCWCSALEAFIMVDYLTCVHWVPFGPESEKLINEGTRCGNLLGTISLYNVFWSSSMP